ncbi:MAG: HNH endonuclease [Bacteroidales bacterium]|nr:HNH endonuclease [Bacteroidales bacterium]
MKHWIIPSNNKRFRLDDFLQEHDCVDWKKGKYKFKKGDIVYIYCSQPIAQIRYMMEVIADNISYEESIKDEEYWVDKNEFREGIEQNNYCRLKLLLYTDSSSLSYSNLLKNGLKTAPQGAIFKLSEQLLKYLQDCFACEKYFDPIELTDTLLIREGAVKSIMVNKYERNQIARKKCIDVYGYSCAVCGIDFVEKYGEIGKDFIHVHHKVPISTIKEDYQINPIEDLIPVCPNCHAMLHRKLNGEFMSIDELRSLLK